MEPEVLGGADDCLFWRWCCLVSVFIGGNGGGGGGGDGGHFLVGSVLWSGKIGFCLG